ncbi:YciI family protein [Williamsia sp. SKLECPSW1]
MPASASDGTIWVVDLTYTAALTEVDRWRDAHLAVLADFAGRGVVAASGPKDPRTGGIIVTHPVARAAVDELIAADPFAIKSVADYVVTGLHPPPTAV